MRCDSLEACQMRCLLRLSLTPPAQMTDLVHGEVGSQQPEQIPPVCLIQTPRGACFNADQASGNEVCSASRMIVIDEANRIRI